MEVTRARIILGDKYITKTDKDIQTIIDLLKPLVKITINEVEKKFNLIKTNESCLMEMEDGI
jgi:hypothetical protein